MKQLPIYLDLFAIFIFLGTMQGYYLSYFFLVGTQRKVLANRVLGLLLLSIVLMLGEVLLGYTNYMGRIPWVVDVSEPLNYAIGPLIYLYLYTKVYPRVERYQWLHFAFFAFYTLYLGIFWHSQSLEFKYNGFITAFHPDQPELFVRTSQNLPDDPLHIRNYVNHLTFVHFLIYVVLGFYMVKQAFRKAQLPFWSKQDPTLTWVRSLALQFALVTLLFIVIKVSFKNDLGDHIIAAHIALLMYVISFSIIRQSLFFEPEEKKVRTTGKYQKSSLSNEKEQQALIKLRRLMEEEKPFMESTLSLPGLAKKLSLSTHHLSQIINDNLQQNFFEMLASYRVQEAQSILCDPYQKYLKIEEIAEMVGYNSKSAFNAAFKKITHFTPSQYRKNSCDFE